MPKWKRQDETVCMPNTVCCALASDGEEARLICAAHNADIDALETEIQQFRDAYAHDREIMADNVAQLGSYESRIDALTAERDELQRRLDAVVMLSMNTKPRPKHEDFHPFDYEQWNDAVCAWDRNAARHARAVAIAEGREG